MIISASYRTDIPAFYGAWFRRRLEAGFCRTVNPYGGQVSLVPLTGAEVDGFVFWTRNIEPFQDTLRMLRRSDQPFVVQYTVTGYPRALETSVVAAECSIDLIRGLAAEFGSRSVVWRYDPVVVTSLTPPEWHEATFTALAAALAGVVDEVVVSIAHIYRKTQRNMDAAARAHGFTWHDPADEEKRHLLTRLAAIASAHGMRLTLCGQAGLLAPGVTAARCIDAERLSDVAGRFISARARPHRPCGCAQSRDIGDYDTCPHGCVYCYAVSSRTQAKRAFDLHDPDAETLKSGAAS
ncbi:MAG: DUF1848 domain-containing protein [Alphaproteobacteria bacterium]